jgi:anaerobic ribonucleoside-triphosphate reductase activating protein
VTIDDLESQILAIEGIDGVTFSGGEPFAQAEQLAELAKKLRKSGLTVCCYTGYTLEQLRADNRKDWNDLLEQIDLLIDGPFIQSERCHEPYRGSANQNIIFLSDQIRPEEVSGDQTAEFTLGCDGKIFKTGFPNSVGVDETFAEIAEILGEKS